MQLLAQPEKDSTRCTTGTIQSSSREVQRVMLEHAIEVRELGQTFRELHPHEVPSRAERKWSNSEAEYRLLPPQD